MRDMFKFTRSGFEGLLLQLILLLVLFFQSSCQNLKNENMEKISLIVLDPGHFHAALLQKDMFPEVDSIVHVFAPKGKEVEAYLAYIQQYNSRPEVPTKWEEKVYLGDDFLSKMVTDKPGNLVIIAGNNQKKTRYIYEAVSAGLNVLSDKPMAINEVDFELLKEAFSVSSKSGTLLYDMMTSRYEITNILERELCQNKQVFGELEKGTGDNPAVSKQSTHYFFKSVSGKPLVRPAWYFDTDQNGEGIVDITTHLADLVQWECFPENILDYKKDIEMLSAKRWATKITGRQFEMVTQKDSFPGYLKKDIKDDTLYVYANGEMNYTIKGIHTRVSVTWDFQAPEGTGDSYFSTMRGTKANISIRQGKEQGYLPTVYIEPAGKQNKPEFKLALNNWIEKVNQRYPGIQLKENNENWQIIIPDKLKLDHENQFSKVALQFMEYLRLGKIPDWEISFMLTKYYTTIQALEKARGN